MKRFYKIMLRAAIVALIPAFILLFYRQDNADSINAQNIDIFSELLDTHNVTVVGFDSYLSDFQLKGFIDMIDSSNSVIIDKFTEKLTTEENKTRLSPHEVLELHYYVMPENEQDDFIIKVANKKIDISMSDNAILISYNN